MGGKIEEREDGFIVEGPTELRGTVCNTYEDHRIAMALTIAGLIAHGETKILGAQCIRISFPEFIEIIKEIGSADCISIEDSI